MRFTQQTYQFKYRDLKFDTGLIETLMGNIPGETDPLFLNMVEDIDRQIGEVCDIRAEVRIFENVGFPEDGLTLRIGEVSLEPGKIICRQLRRSENIAIILCTAGKDITGWMKKENLGGDMLKAYIIDLFGSEIVEAAIDKVQSDFEGEMKKEGMKITNRYSPGYCGWNTAEQHKLFSLFPDNFPGITLSDTALMQPIKSVSCVIGIGKDVHFNPYTCGICDFDDCIYRERKGRKKQDKKMEKEEGESKIPD